MKKLFELRDEAVSGQQGSGSRIVVVNGAACATILEVRVIVLLYGGTLYLVTVGLIIVTHAVHIVIAIIIDIIVTHCYQRPLL